MRKSCSIRTTINPSDTCHSEGYTYGHEQRRPPNDPQVFIYDLTVFQDLSKVKVDIESLRSLASLGIDVEFLNDAEEDIAAAQKDYGIGPALRHTAEVLQRLHKEQWDRCGTTPRRQTNRCTKHATSARSMGKRSPDLLIVVAGVYVTVTRRLMDRHPFSRLPNRLSSILTTVPWTVIRSHYFSINAQWTVICGSCRVLH